MGQMQVHYYLLLCLTGSMMLLRISSNLTKKLLMNGKNLEYLVWSIISSDFDFGFPEICGFSLMEMFFGVPSDQFGLRFFFAFNFFLKRRLFASSPRDHGPFEGRFCIWCPRKLISSLSQRGSHLSLSRCSSSIFLWSTGTECVINLGSLLGRPLKNDECSFSFERGRYVRLV